MKLLLLQIVAAIVCFHCTYANELEITARLSGLFRVERSVSGLRLKLKREVHRRKRDSTDDMMTLMCMERCLQNLEQGLITMGLNEQAGTMLNKQLYDRSNFDQYCRLSMGGKFCVTTCLEGGEYSADVKAVQEIADGMFSLLAYVCQDKVTEFRAALPCLRKSESEVEAVCVPECGDVSLLLETIEMNMERITGTGNMNLFSNEMRKICKLVSCEVMCENRVLTNVCGGNQEAKLLATFSEMGLTSTRKLLEFPGGMKYWPQGCENTIKILHTISTENNSTDVEELLINLFNTTSPSTTEDFVYTDISIATTSDNILQEPATTSDYYYSYPETTDDFKPQESRTTEDLPETHTTKGTPRDAYTTKDFAKTIDPFDDIIEESEDLSRESATSEPGLPITKVVLPPLAPPKMKDESQSSANSSPTLSRVHGTNILFALLLLIFGGQNEVA